VSGNRVYWTEAGRARSVRLDGVASGREDRVLEPVQLPRHRDACSARPGTTVAASPDVRVYDTTRGRRACRTGTRGVISVDAGAAQHRDLRIVANRWVLVRDADRLRVLDTKAGTVIARFRGSARAATLTATGTAAWIDEHGRLLAQRANAKRAVLLAGAARALAASRLTIYWTAEDGPHRAR
jgi:hypothetical protein